MYNFCFFVCRRKTRSKIFTMQLFIHVKQIGKRRSITDKKPICLDPPPTTAAQLIADVVCSEVQAYNDRPTPDDWVVYLTHDQIQQKAIDGKISFGVNYNGVSACVETAVLNALQSFEDGIFRLFLNESEIESLQTPLLLKEGDTLTFIRLTLLAGRIW